ncbi:amidohydrolase family protein [Pectobacterium sp. A5351]|uniref:amidohydrolase family protein n=1 Tax=Pectobacterium sp. A5351 TaxID=2914983 RepID=UPI00232ADCD4|nr:amidohydrolase family protein [Pectobacterium sp. A5351]WCG82847.1 amidohydrolase family protein [Pectobacterium sp. A5351]
MDKEFIFRDISYLDSTSMKLVQGDISMMGDVITYVGEKRKGDVEGVIIPSEQFVVLPGLVNAHLHPSKEIYGSILDASPIDVVLDSVHRNNTLEDAEGQYVASLKSLMMAMKKGITTVGIFTSRIESDIRAIQQVKSRCVINFCQSNQWVGNGKGPENESVETIFYKYLLAEEKYQSELITILPATASELSADDILLKKLHQLANHHQKKFTLHIHEGAYQVDSHRNIFGVSGIERFARLGILDKHTTLIHCCHLSDSELDILLSTQCHIIHCPVSNSFVGAGTLPLRRLSSHLDLGLGTDAAMVNPGNDLTFDALFALYHHGDANFDTKVDAGKILHMITEGGAKSLGLMNVGRIARGFKADLIFFDKTCIDVDYINTPISLLKMLHYENPCKVIVNGDIRLDNGQFIDPVLEGNNEKFSEIRRKIII